MPPITLRTRYAMSCTNVGYTGTAYHLLRLRHAVSGTEKGYVYQVEYRVHRLEQHGTGLPPFRLTSCFNDDLG